MQKINILGLTLTDYSLKESLYLTDEYIHNGALNTLIYITAPMLILAGKEEAEKERIEAMDMTLCGDEDLLKVAKIESKSRLYEVANQVFIKEFLRRIVRETKKVYLLAETEAEITGLRRELEEFQEGIPFCGSAVIGEEIEDIGTVINAINDIAPAVVISRTSPGRQELWMTVAKPFLNAEVWLGIPKDMKLARGKETLRNRALDKVYKTMFRRRMNKYNETGDKEE